MLPLRRQRAIRAGAATEPAAAAAAGSEAKPAAAPASSADDRIKRVKEVAESATAVAKALLFFGALAIVGTIVATTLWRDRHARHVEVAIDPEAEKTLRAMGSQIDLRQTFVDVLNARIRGVEQVFALNFAQLIDTRDAPDVSFKPFGLDASTGQITKIVRELTGADPPTAVRVELLCPKAKCDDTGASGATLLVTVVDRAGSERLAVPIGGVADGLPRRLREAMRQAADLLLERAEPLISAVYYLNIGPQHPFPDDTSRDLQRAMASALRLRDANGQPTCIANLIIGGTLFKRNAWEDGLVVEQHAGLADDVVCKVHAATNIVFFLVPYACEDDPRERDFALRTSTDALATIADLGTGKLDATVADRIPAAKLVLESQRFIRPPEMDGTRRALCFGERAASGDAAAIERFVGTLLDGTQKTLPPRTDQRSAQGMLRAAVDLTGFAMPKQAIAVRYRASLATMRVIERYLPTDPTPRRLFFLRGLVATEMAAAAKDGIAQSDGARRAILRELGIDATSPAFDSAAPFRQQIQSRLLEARVDFENALAADSSAVIGEAAADVALANAQGDASLAVEDLRAARNGYLRAVDAFLAAEAPVDQLLPLADTVARLAVLDRQTGDCALAAKADGARSPAARLGFAVADWCALGERDTLARPGLVGIVAAMAKPSIERCGPFTPSTTESPYAAFDWTRCARANAPSTWRIARSVLGRQNGAALRIAIEEALKGGAPAGT